MPIDPAMIQGLGMDWSRRGGVARGMDEIVNLVQTIAPETVPDKPWVREAFDAWGIQYKEGGEPIVQMVTTVKTLIVELPPGWRFSREGGGGHNDLLDERGVSRMHWYIHGWDPVDVRINERFTLGGADLSVTDSVVQVLDGNTVIHAIPFRLPHAREVRPHRDGIWYAVPSTFTAEQRRENDEARSAAKAAARAWLDENRPGYKDVLGCWLI